MKKAAITNPSATSAPQTVPWIYQYSLPPDVIEPGSGPYILSSLYFSQIKDHVMYHVMQTILSYLTKEGEGGRIWSVHVDPINAILSQALDS